MSSSRRIVSLTLSRAIFRNSRSSRIAFSLPIGIRWFTARTSFAGLKLFGSYDGAPLMICMVLPIAGGPGILSIATDWGSTGTVFVHVMLVPFFSPRDKAT